MLELTVYDNEEAVKLKFEHSLLSLSKWEAKHKKAFLTNLTKSPTELVDYFQDMLLSPEDRGDLVYRLDPKQLDELAKYINDPRTASSVPQEKTTKFNPETTTSELIYYWLAELKIPFHPTETWHLNRLMMLVQITNYKKQPPKKRKPSEVMKDWATINERQKRMLGTNG